MTTTYCMYSFPVGCCTSSPYKAHKAQSAKSGAKQSLKLPAKTPNDEVIMPSIRRGILPRLTYTRERTKCILLALASRVWKRVYSVLHCSSSSRRASQPSNRSLRHQSTYTSLPPRQKRPRGKRLAPKTMVRSLPGPESESNRICRQQPRRNLTPRPAAKKKTSVVTCIHECRHLIASVDFVNPSGGPQATCGRLVRVLQYLGLVVRAVFL